MATRYFEDFKVGDRFEGATWIDVTQESIIAFAREFDPQPFHLDPEAASRSLFGRLVASGWHTTAMTMRLFAEVGLDIVNGIIGAGVDSVNWPRAVEPGDRLRLRCEIHETRVLSSKPDRGMLRVQVETVNQDDAVVQRYIANLIALRRVPG
jgi:acyl dehydratase